jgi:hypothetical protein
MNTYENELRSLMDKMILQFCDQLDFIGLHSYPRPKSLTVNDETFFFLLKVFLLGAPLMIKA